METPFGDIEPDWDLVRCLVGPEEAERRRKEFHSVPMITANGLRGATLHTGSELKPLDSIDVVWGSTGRIVSMTWDDFRNFVANALDEDRIPRLDVDV